MKLKKMYAGEYRGEETIDGFKVVLEVSSLENRGFSFSYFVNDTPVYMDGWYGLRLCDIKNYMKQHIEDSIEEYKANKVN